MADLLIRELPEEVVAALDSIARKLGLSRAEYLRRKLIADASRSTGDVTVADLEGFALTFSDLADPAVMGQAWE